MPDITMCLGKDCPFKTECYRYMAIPTKQIQSYFLDIPMKQDGCKYLIPVINGLVNGFRVRIKTL